ncbi:unnamed protein product, partial [Rotaria sp. Silwood1]
GIKMLVAVVVLYAILWLPMNVFQLCLNLICYQGTTYQTFCTHPILIKLLYIAAHFLTVSNTAINPIIYGFTNNRFRSDIRQLSRRLIHCQGRTPIYYQARFAKNHLEEPVDGLHNSKRNLPCTVVKNPRICEKLNTKRPLSLTDQNKFYRTKYTTNILDKDHFITKTRHTT